AKALRPLIVAVAGEIGATDEALCPTVERDFETAVLNLRHADRDDVAFLQRGHLGHRIERQLLHAEADALLFGIDIEHLDLDGLALLVLLDHLITRLVPRQIGEMHHAVDVAGKPNEQTELGDVADLAFEHRTRRMTLAERDPRILEALLQAEADAA